MFDKRIQSLVKIKSLLIDLKMRFGDRFALHTSARQEKKLT